jgi:CRISPR-associated protein Csd1
MSWIQRLYETYNNCQSCIGYSTQEGERPLLPICHITAQAHIEITIDENSKFRRANIITDQKNDGVTIIPATEGSASRSGSKPECHPLCDKLQYVAGDYVRYGGITTSGYTKEPEKPYNDYVHTLSKWCESEFSHPKALTILSYIKNKTVIKDLVESGIILLGTDENFLTKGETKREKNSVDLFSILNSQNDAFVRWLVETPEVLESRTWKDKTLWDSWISYYMSSKVKEPLCFVTGEKAVLSTNHPKYIRVKGDGAKIISSNDNSGFTFRGRFKSDDQACNVSLEASQKAHYALIWLISRQGKVFWVKSGGKKEPGLTIVAWAASKEKIPQPTDDAVDILGFEELISDEVTTSYTAQDIALKLQKKILGYSSRVSDINNIQIIAMASASKGRLSITYYQEQNSLNYLANVNKWHKECQWVHSYRFKELQDERTGKSFRKYYIFVGAPAPIDIAEAAYGEKADDKLKSATITRILPCIIEGRPIPQDLVISTVRRASNRLSMENWEWNKTLTIACALYKKYNQKENYKMTLDPERKTRDYLYGRLLALADSLEEWALFEAKETRQTNAARLMQRFSEHPYSTWRTIELSLTPYKARLGVKSTKRQRMIDEVIASFKDDDFLNDKRLSGEFLLGYHCQREHLRNRSDNETSADEAE